MSILNVNKLGPVGGSSTITVAAGVASYTGKINCPEFDNNPSFTGNVTIAGNLGVAGTITYEDVARVDATGISTFREGYQVGPLTGIALTAYKDGSIRSTGIITASSFVGDVTGTASTATSASTAYALDSAANITTGIVTATAFIPSVGQLSHRNLIINGAMTVAQYGASETSVDGIQGYTTVDRWKIGWAGANNIIEAHQHALTSSDTGPWAKGFRNSYKLINGAQSSADAADEMHISYRLEAQDLANSGWNYTSSSSYITLSFWVKSSVAQEFHGFLLTADGTAQLYSFSLGSLSANTWTKVTKTIPGNSNLQFDDNHGEGLLIRIALFRGTSKTGTITQNQWAAFNSNIRYPNYTSTWWTTNDAEFELTGVQLEVGSVATPFEHRSFGDELARCQRYCYEHLYPNANQYASIMLGGYYNSSRIYGSIKFPVTMRVPPTMVCSDIADAFNCYRNGGVDFVNEFHIDSANNVGPNAAEILNDTDASGTGGHATIVRRGSNATTVFRFQAEF